MILYFNFFKTLCLSVLIACLANSCVSQSTKNQKVEDSSIVSNDTLINDPLPVDPIIEDSVVRIEKEDVLVKDVEIDTAIKQPSVISVKKLSDSVRRELDKKPKHIYLTFDDGPLIGSRAIDSIITSRNIKISAFLIGKHANMSKHLMKSYQIYYNNPLVDCYNHSFTHANNQFQLFYSNPEKAAADFEKNELDLALKHKIIRMPGRNIWYFDDIKRIDLTSGSSTSEILYNKGFKIYGWDVEWRINGVTGKPVQTVPQVYNRIKNYMNNKTSLFANNVVLLMHDDMFQNKSGQKQLSALLDSLQKHPDYKFEFIKDYPFKYN